jgi:hypothetical protein
MERTLDEYLAEIDQWKEAVSSEVSGLSSPELAQRDRDAQSWLEAELRRHVRRGRAKRRAVGPH